MTQPKLSQLRSPSSFSPTVAQSPIVLNDSKYDSRLTTASSWVALRLPTFKQIGRFLLWGSGRLTFSGILFSLDATSQTLATTQTIIKWTKQSVVNLLTIYDQLPYNGTHSRNLIEATAIEIPDEPEDIITDIVEAIEGRQVMVIGEMGTGKSTLAQYLAYTVGGKVKVYECEGTPDDWQGLEVVGKGENWNAIAAGMKKDLDDLSKQMKLREQYGDKYLDGSEKVIICEEYPEMPSKVSISDEWLTRHARRGRKARRFTILLSQYDRVAAWGLEGKSDLADAFWRIRLGKKAISHAKSLKSDGLIAWLKKDRSHALLDDSPCKLPPYREMKAVISRPFSNQEIVSQNTGEKISQPAQGKDFEEKFSDSDAFLWRLIQRYGEEKSDSAIVTEVLGMTGKKYAEGKDLLERLRRQFGE